ncbi:XK-related protein 9 [Periophthalmus magnuspinnatus]|uniref:XK-related protein n=1 Tax=Periophthalmus magnuspinnatus TaxID=409849 RepID=A0A3B4A400_9GOBI|nr:XK-related protein 9 [Periophthalmus magnuspinnatus]
MSTSEYTKLRWGLTIAGLCLYAADIWTDICLALTYYQEEHYLWAGLTLAFILTGMLVSQIFSFAWYWDDMNDFFINPNGKATQAGLSKSGLGALHVFGLGIFTRYYQLLKKGYGVLWNATHFPAEEKRQRHHNLFCMATDLSMLKLFETFLESAPQLLLQVYIVLLGHREATVLNYVSMAFSFLSIAWSLVDYRRCLRRSLPHISEMPSGLPTAVYLLYKLCTITSLILSYSLYLIISAYTTVALTAVWLAMLIWTNILQTEFCSHRGLEILYRAVVGVILTFTFFNVKGQDTKVPMGIYYSIFCIINVSSPILLSVLMPEFNSSTLLAVDIFILCCVFLGLFCLVLYYVLLHPRVKLHDIDEVDGPGEKNNSVRRINTFLQP